MVKVLTARWRLCRCMSAANEKRRMSALEEWNFPLGDYSLQSLDGRISGAGNLIS